MIYTEIDTMFRDAGDVGGDSQAGPAFNRRFEVAYGNEGRLQLDFYTYDARHVEPPHDNDVLFVQTMVMLTEYKAGIEVRSDVIYWDGAAEGETAEQQCAAIGQNEITTALDQMGY